ncbi:MAG: hypothetical protein K0S43_195 [Cellulosimicrobium sp.]|nr:hypothetical protein [Cellulosimicrobium sp.]
MAVGGAHRQLGVRRAAPLPPAGFGSVKVEVTLGAQRWSTSVFPDAQRKTFVVPIKAAVRRAEGVDVGDRVTIGVETLL